VPPPERIGCGILLCGKCARKLDGGYGQEEDATLRSALCMALKLTAMGGFDVQVECIGHSGRRLPAVRQCGRNNIAAGDARYASALAVSITRRCPAYQVRDRVARPVRLVD
jgi:hypothetical protein